MDFNADPFSFFSLLRKDFFLVSVSRCYQNKCANGATCYDVASRPSYTCGCPPGWRGPLCDQGICNAARRSYLLMESARTVENKTCFSFGEKIPSFCFIYLSFCSSHSLGHSNAFALRLFLFPFLSPFLNVSRLVQLLSSIESVSTSVSQLSILVSFSPRLAP